jgi:hypothetical protein
MATPTNLVAIPIDPQGSTTMRGNNKLKVLNGAWSCSLKQINKGMIKIFDTPYIRVLQVLLKECFYTMGVSQTK